MNSHPKISNTVREFLRYIVVGAIAFAADFGLLWVLTEFFSCYYLLSASISFVAGLVVNYVLSKLWVFRESSFTNRTAEFILFAVIGVIGLGLNALFIYIFTQLCGIYYLISKIITTAIVFLWNFGARKVAIFTKKI